MGVKLYISSFQNTKNLELSISQFGDAELEAGWFCKCSSTLYNRLYLFESGDSVLQIGDSSIHMQPGVAYLIPVGMNADVRCREKTNKLYFHFNLFRFGKHDLFAGIDKVLPMEFPLSMVQTLRAHGQGNSVHDSMAIKQILYSLLSDIQCKYDFSQSTIPSYSGLITNAIAFIQSNLSAKIALDEIAKHCKVSRSLLSKVFCEEVGMPIGKYIDNQLLITAQWELHYTNSSIKEISRMLGYSDPCYFSRRFKQLSGVSPIQYRIDKNIL